MRGKSLLLSLSAVVDRSLTINLLIQRRRLKRLYSPCDCTHRLRASVQAAAAAAALGQRHGGIGTLIYYLMEMHYLHQNY